MVLNAYRHAEGSALTPTPPANFDDRNGMLSTGGGNHNNLLVCYASLITELSVAASEDCAKQSAIAFRSVKKDAQLGLRHHVNAGKKKLRP